jgi:defect-in-organelle-trafficking protein DotC
MAFDIPPSSPPMELEQVIEQASVANQAKSKIPELRYQAIKESGMEYGSRTGLVRRGYEITQQLNARSSQLDKAYPLPKLMLDDNVVPPVLEESKDNLNKDSNTALRLSDATYKITENAHFVTTPPTWRDYLLVGLTYSVEVPNPTLMPKTPEEKQVWEEAVKEGWQVGIKQANQIFNVQLNKLERDIKGMGLYRSLLTRNMVTKPFVAVSNLGVTGDNKKINVNDRVLRITALAGLKTDSKEWKPVGVPVYGK